MAKETRDLATVFCDAYSLAVPALIGEQHSFLLAALEKHFAKIPAGTLIVVGPGGQALPYSREYKEGRLGGSNRDRIKKLLKDGRAIFVDYVKEKEKGGLEQEIRTFATFGFFEPGYFSRGAMFPRRICNKDLRPGTFSFLLNNARDPLRIEDRVADAIDANLSLHHAYVNRKEMKKIFQELYRILKPGGILHLGEGDIDMNYTEDKIIKIATDISRILKKNIALADNREEGSGYVVRAFFAYGREYPSLPTADSLPENNCARMTITKDGMVVLAADKPNEIALKPRQIAELSQKLKTIGYKQLSVLDGLLLMPLIDPEMQADQEQMLRPVDAYYDAVQRKARKGLQRRNAPVYRAISEGLEFERRNAKRGIVEYFMSDKKIIQALEKAGFVDMISTNPNIGPLYNILAHKRS